MGVLVKHGAKYSIAAHTLYGTLLPVVYQSAVLPTATCSHYVHVFLVLTPGRLR